MKPPLFHPQPHSRAEIIVMRVLFALMLLDVIPGSLHPQHLAMPLGLAGMGLDLSWLPGAMPWLKGLSYALLLVYALGRVPWLTTTLLFAITLLVGTYHNSNGSIKHHHQVVSLILLAQALWHWWWLFRHRRASQQHADDGLVCGRWAAFVSQQAIVAAYVVTGITKVATSGFFGWISQAANYPVQIRKTNLQAMYSKAEASVSAGAKLEDWLALHPAVGQVMLGTGLVLELGAFLALLGRRWSFFYGILLIAFHALNSVFMNLNFRWHNEAIAIFLIFPPAMAAVRHLRERA